MAGVALRSTTLSIAANLRAVLAAHVTFQFVDGRCLWPADNVQGHCLMSVTAEAADLKVVISRVQRVAEAGRGLSRSFESKHALVPGNTRQTVSSHPSLGRALRRMPNRTAVDALARFGAHQGKNAPAWLRSASRSDWAGSAWAHKARVMPATNAPRRTLDLIVRFFAFVIEPRHISCRQTHRAGGISGASATKPTPPSDHIPLARCCAVQWPTFHP
jgi:hypothetical protein